MTDRSILKNKILVDLENTLSNSSHRMRFLNKDNERFKKEFVNDPPNQNVINFVNSLHNNNYDICITVISAQKEEYKQDAETWLKKYQVEYAELIMQPDRDKRKPFDFKSEYVKRNRSRFLFALDDVSRTCDMIAENYIPVLKIYQEK